jgi:SAM-dependent methyltransferase
VRESWTVAASYEAYVGRWSRLVAPEFLRWLEVPPGGLWLDVGCGTGALTAAILSQVDPTEVVGVDPSEEFLADAAAQVTDPRATFRVGDAASLPELPDGRFDATVSALALNFVPEPHRAMTELVRVTRPGGLVAAYVWDYAERMDLIRHFWTAAVHLDPAAAHLDEAVRFPLCRPAPLRELWTAAELLGVDVRPVDVPTPFADFDDYWAPFLGGQGPAPAYATSLPEARRRSLADLLRARLPAGPDGSIQLSARAWAVRGAVPTVLTHSPHDD